MQKRNAKPWAKSSSLDPILLDFYFLASQFCIYLGMMAAMYAVSFTVANLVGRVLVRTTVAGVKVMDKMA